MRNIKGKVMCIVLSMSLMLGGCGMTTAESRIKAETTAFSAEEVKANRISVMTSEEREGMLYSYVSSAVQVDTSKLIAVEATDAKALKQRVVDMNKALQTGELRKIENKKVVFDSGISESFANYMLWNFSKTPYSWNMTDCKIVGMDAATHLYFVDVTYKNTGAKKAVLPDSLLVEGQPDYSYVARMRFDAYKEYCQKYKSWKFAVDTRQAADGTNGNTSDAKIAEQYREFTEKFENRWGKLDELIKVQKEESPLERAGMYKNTGIGSYAYCFQPDELFQGSAGGAEMKYRIVFGYAYNLGESVDLAMRAVYLTSYKNNLADENSLKSEIVAEEILTPLVRRTLRSYFVAEDETNHRGLFSLFSSMVYDSEATADEKSEMYPYYKAQMGYEKYDTYYKDYNALNYHKTGTYLYTLLGRKDNLLYVKVSLNVAERAKGSAMSSPTYRKDMLVTLQLRPNDTMGVKDVSVIGMTILGEPLSVISKVTGVSEQMLFTTGGFTASNKAKVESVIKDFMKLELSHNFDSSVFTCIDIGISSTQLENIRNNIDAMKADEIITWQTEYTTESNMYVAVNLREVFINNTTGSKNEVESLLELVNRSGKWFVISYTRTMNALLKKKVAEDYCLEHYKMVDGEIKSVKKNLKVAEEAGVAVSDTPS